MYIFTCIYIYICITFFKCILVIQQSMLLQFTESHSEAFVIGRQLHQNFGGMQTFAFWSFLFHARTAIFEEFYPILCCESDSVLFSMAFAPRGLPSGRALGSFGVN